MTSCLYLDTPIGFFEIQGSPHGLSSVKRVEKTGKDSKKPAACVLEGRKQLQEYFARKRKQFDVLLDWREATEFHRGVWSILREIPYGHTSSYSRIAEKLGDVKKLRAVGQANRLNPIAIIVPCHRVIAKNGDLHGYFYGLDVKRKLLELENPMSFAEQGALF